MGRPLPNGTGLALYGKITEPALVSNLEARLGSTARVRGVKVSVLERRTLRYELELEGLASPSHLRLIGKVYESRQAGELGFAAMRWLNEQGMSSRSTGCAGVPRAVAYLPEFALLLMEEVRGPSLRRMLKVGTARPEHLRLTARALLELHGLPNAFGARFTLDDHLAVRCAGLAGPVHRAFPGLAHSIEHILARARGAEEGELAPACTVAHGDCRAGQIHIDGERAWFVDPDSLHQGNPGYDLALVLFSLKRLETARAHAHRIAPLRATFLETYFERVDPRRASRLPIDVALIYLKRACGVFRRQSDGWQDVVRGQIERAEGCIDWLERAPPCRTVTDVLELDEHLPAPDC